MLAFTLGIGALNTVYILIMCYLFFQDEFKSSCSSYSSEQWAWFIIPVCEWRRLEKAEENFRVTQNETARVQSRRGREGLTDGKAGPMRPTGDGGILCWKRTSTSFRTTLWKHELRQRPPGCLWQIIQAHSISLEFLSWSAPDMKKKVFTKDL